MADFNPDCYLARYPDVRQRWHGTPEQHWLQHGQFEGREPGCDAPGTTYSPDFNEACYLARYPDVANPELWSGTAIDHWMQFGQAEGRIPGCKIDPANPGSIPTPGSSTDTPPAASTGRPMWPWLVALALAGIALHNHKKPSR